MTMEDSHAEALLESAQLLHASLDLDSLLRHLLRSIMGRLLVKKAVLALEDDGVMRVSLVKGLPSIVPGSLFDFKSAEAAGIEKFYSIGNETPVGHLGLVVPNGATLSEDAEGFLSALLGIAASGIANAKAHAHAKSLNTNLERKVQQLRTLLELVRGLTSALDPAQLASLLGLTLAGQWAVRKYAVIAWKEGQPIVTAQKGIAAGDIQTVVPAFERLDAPLLIAGHDEAGHAAARTLGIAAIVPIRTLETTSGLIFLGTRPGGREYSDEDLDYTFGLAAQAAVAFENAWLFRETVEKKKLEKELELASEIQKRLLPASMPQIDGFEIAARSRPARQVGGDYYDVLPVSIPFPSQPHLACVADVSGKGIAASLLMSNFQATLRALLTPDRPLTSIVGRMNDLVHATTASNKYVTAIFGIIEPSTGQCTFVNAGHNDGLLLRADGSVERLKACGLSVGLMPGRPYRDGSFEMQPGDVMVLYSDGVTEANDPDENEFEDDRLLDVVRENLHESAESIVARVFEAVDTFAGSAPQYDDITAMIVKRVDMPETRDAD